GGGPETPERDRNHGRSQGRRSRDRPGTAGSARHRGHRTGGAVEMNLASFVERYGRAIAAITVVLAAAGLTSVSQLPADIYPPLIFPRGVVIGHRGTLPGPPMMLTGTLPIEP